MKASLFITCICDNFYPEIGESMLKILRKYGVDVDFPYQQTCCGQPAFNTGYWDDARTVARTVVDAFKDSQYVVAPSGSCIAMIKEYYPVLFAKDPGYAKSAEELAGKVYEFSQFLVEVIQVQELNCRFPYQVTFHPSCHGSRLLGLSPIINKLLNMVEGLKLVELPHAEQCCGFGGTFSVKMPEISKAMVDEKVDHILETGADYVVGMDMGCLMNIGGRLQKEGHNIKTIHIAQLLDEGMTR
ncbi:MAG: (Fe-S)-binding protein [Peptococcaceae bacterium]